MQLPFSLDEFLGVFRQYNEAIGVMPLLLVALAVGLVALAHARNPSSHRNIALGLAALWLWSGMAYHWAFFASINPAARFLAGAFVLQGVLLISMGAFRGRLQISPRNDRRGVLGWLFIAYALVGYPVAGWALGHGYPEGPSFGAPCPTTIFFLGMMFWTKGRIPIALVVIPIAWAAIGTGAALQLGMREDLGLALAAVLLVAEMVRERLSHGAASGSWLVGVRR